MPTWRITETLIPRTEKHKIKGNSRRWNKWQHWPIWQTVLNCVLKHIQKRKKLIPKKKSIFHWWIMRTKSVDHFLLIYKFSGEKKHSKASICEQSMNASKEGFYMKIQQFLFSTKCIIIYKVNKQYQQVTNTSIYNVSSGTLSVYTVRLGFTAQLSW